MHFRIRRVSPGAGYYRPDVIYLFLVTLAACVCAKAQNPRSSNSRTQHIDIGGRKLTLLTEGHGGPTVVIEPGLGAAVVENGEWNRVCDEIAKTNLVCLYDRAGLGTSDAAPTRPRTSQDVAGDLHALLSNAKIPGPYVLVGHSIGGLNVRIFAKMYPADVAGIVLVDATHPDQEREWFAALPAQRPGEDPEVTKARDFLAARLAAPAENPEALDIVASGAQVRAAGTLGSKPLAVLTHSPDWKMVPSLPDDVSRQLERVSQDLQNELPGLSTNSTHAIARKAGHHIHVDDPDLVIKAIREVVAKVQAGAPR